MVGRVEGQTDTGPANPFAVQSTTGTGDFGNPPSDGPDNIAMPPARNSQVRQNDQDISSPRRQDQMQPRLNPQSVPPAPLTEYQRVVAASTGFVLPIFGSDLFRVAPSTFAPVDNIPVTPDYVIGPGDEIRLQIWGQINQHGSFIVDRTGSIALPQVGTIHVAGIQFSQLSDFLKSQLARVYRNFDLNVNLGQLRSIQVFVVGQVRQPGSYTIGSLSTLLNALFASGGPLPQGSLRDIQIKRGGQTITHFDLYDLLLRGDKTRDVRLEPGDVIFIPDVGPQVAILGSVTSPGIYELHGETSFSQAVSLAGGLTNVASGSTVRVERIYKHAQRSELEVNLAGSDAPAVQDGDIISAISIVDRFENAVTLRGNVANPGRYVWHQGMRISDLIPSKDLLITRNYYKTLDQLGHSRSEYIGPALNANNLGASANTNYNGSNSSLVPSPDGSSSNNGTYNNSYDNGSNNSYSNIGNNGVPASSDYGSQAQQGALGIQSGAVADAASQRSTLGSNGGGNSLGATLTGGSTNFAPTTDVILSAPDIDWDYAVIERQSQATLKTSLIPFNLGKVILENDPSQNLELLNGDVVTIFSKADIRVPSEQQTKFVRLEGEFAASGVYSVLPGETLRQLLIRAGGLSPDAYLYASEFTRDSVRRTERQRLIEYADALEGEINARSATLASSALTDRDAAAAQESGAQSRATLARLRQVQPTGRIVFQLKPDAKSIADIPDLPLEDGDRFVVPKKPSSVSVQGQVYDANAFVYQKGKRVKDYLHLAGGPDRNADRKREFILRADGSVVSHQYASFEQRALFADHDFDDIPLLPGDTIVVPPVIEKGSVLRNLTNLATIVEGFGLGAAAIEVLK
jgi:polysaccharide export outer membrane protein